METSAGNRSSSVTSLSKGPNWRRYRRLIFVPASLALALLVWELVVHTWNPPPFILPSPGMVWDRFTQVVVDGSLLRHTLVTLSEVMLGLAAGVCVATALGYILAKWPAVERLLSPYVVASQSVPIVAIAPLLVIWFGPGMQSKVLICALIVFFPVLVNTVVGLHSVPEDLRDLMRSLKATRWQTFRLLEAPAALPVFLGGLRIGATLAVIGAVVGEFVGADRGLGFLINRARGQYDTALVFVALLALVLMALSLYGLVLVLERRWLAWQDRNSA
jgi:NitT/TauT family transport system permease protein